jgi:rhomboid protease GluP
VADQESALISGLLLAQVLSLTRWGPIMTLLLVLVLVGFGCYVMEPEERRRILGSVLGVFGVARRLATRRGSTRGPFEEALAARTRWPVVTPAIAVLNLIVFVQLLTGSGALSDPATLIAAGGNFGPHTANGEWGRLVTSLFVHAGPLHLLVNTFALVQLGLVLERLLGHAAFAVVYLGAGTFASVVSLHAAPVEVSVGASGAVSGLYGLLLATWMWGLLRRSALTIPTGAVKALGPTAVVFFLYSALDGSVQSTAEWLALAVGFTAGAVLATNVATAKPRPRPIAATAVTALLISVASAVPLRGIANVKPEVERLVAVEERISSTYGKAVEQFKLGAMTARQLAQLIDRTIRPELEAAKARFAALTGVPAQQQPLVASAQEYLRLRDESWRIRSEALHKANMTALRAADRSERASLEALERTRQVTLQQ